MYYFLRKRDCQLNLDTIHSHDIIFVLYLFQELVRLILAMSFIICYSFTYVERKIADKLSKIFLKLLLIQNPTLRNHF